MSTVTLDGRIVEKGEKVIRVGDHVVDREDRERRMVVTGIPPGMTVEDYEFRPDTTVADVNEEYPADDRVVEVKFVGEQDRYLPDKKYAYPSGRLEVVSSLRSE